jgi:hypothetical protein
MMPHALQKSRWIFGAFSLDMLWLHLPGFVIFALSLFVIPNDSLSFKIYAFVAVVLFDNGHVYSTLWRTYFNRSERELRSMYYVLAPILIFMALAAVARAPHGGKIIFFFIGVIQIWHYLRQSHGISRWYQKKNNIFRPSSEYFLYALCSLPVLSMGIKRYFSWDRSELFPVSSSDVRLVVLFLYFAILCIWIAYEIAIWRRGRELNRVLGIAGPIALFGMTYTGAGFVYYSFALVVSHALPYFAMTHFALKKTGSPHVASPMRTATCLLVPLAIAVVTYSLVTFGQKTTFELLKPFAVLHATAFCCHVLFDGFLWKRSHPEATLIYA